MFASKIVLWFRWMTVSLACILSKFSFFICQHSYSYLELNGEQVGLFLIFFPKLGVSSYSSCSGAFGLFWRPTTMSGFSSSMYSVS